MSEESFNRRLRLGDVYRATGLRQSPDHGLPATARQQDARAALI